MRKAQREVKDPAAILEILENCDVCRLGLADGAQPYVLPLNFGYEMAEGRLTLYFHCAREGRKLDIICRNNRACFEMDCSHQLKTGEKACEYSMNYQSIIGSGFVEVVTDEHERLAGLNCLMKHYSGRDNWSFDARPLSLALVLRLRADEFAAKRLAK
jgi:uncharacterized protein